MRVVVQRVSSAQVTVEGEITGEIGRGLLLLVGIHDDDREAHLAWMAKKCAQLRVFEDDEGRMNRSLVDICGEALVVSQFTLYGDVRKGNRPSFHDAGAPVQAEAQCRRFVELLEGHLDRPVATGRFGAMMNVRLVNQGPVTLLIER